MLNVSTKLKQAASATTAFILTISLLGATLTVVGPQRVAAQTKRDSKSTGEPIITQNVVCGEDGCGPGGPIVVVPSPSPTETPTPSSSPTPSPTPASVLVNSAADPGDGICDAAECTLREAIAAAAPGDTINFNTSGIFATLQTIQLTAGELVISKNLTIVGTGAENLIVKRSEVAAYSRIFFVDSAVTVKISNLWITGGRAVESTQGVAGGGIYNYSGNVSIQNCRLSQNVAEFGAAVANVNGTLLIEGSSIAGNTSNVGGGVFNQGGTVTITNSSIFNNVGIGGAGVANFTNGAMTIENSTISSNHGYIAFTKQLDPSAIGGGILNQESAGLTIRNSTVYGNVALLGGGGIRTVSASLDLDSSIVANNSSLSRPDVYGDVNTGDYNLIKTPFGYQFLNDPQFNMIGSDPQLGGLDYYGGPSPIHPPTCGSPAIDRGGNASNLLTDQRGAGFARTFDVASLDDAPNGGGTDIGAVEVSGLIGIADTYSVSENRGAVANHPQSRALTENDSYPGCGSAIPVLVNPPSHASSFTFSNNFRYIPNFLFNGTDSFTYKLVSGSVESEEVTVSITVNGQNDPPSAADDRYSTAANTIQNVTAAGVMSNDSDPELDQLTALVVSAPAHADSFNLNPDGSFSYLPVSGFVGFDSFTYNVNDGSLDSNVAVVTIRVGANNAPVASSDVYSTAEDTHLSVAAPGVLANDSDSDPGDAITAVLTAGPTNAASFGLNPNGSFSYTPAPNFNGNDSFSYKARDIDASESTIVTVTITVDPVNDAPVAVSDMYLSNGGATLTAAAPGVLGNDTDIEGGSLAATLVDGPGHGTVVLNADGSFNYSPASTFNGSDFFTYKVSDGTLDSNLATVSVGSPLTVNVTADHNDGACEPLASGDCTLREAIAAVAPGGIINFDTAGAFATPTIISLTLGELSITSDLTINGPGADQLSVSGPGSGRVFFVNTVYAAINGITVTGGRTGIYNLGALTLTKSAVSGNLRGGGISNSGALTLTDSTVSGNSGASGGGIYNEYRLTLTNTTVSGNSALEGGGIFNNSYFDVTLTNTTVTGNSANRSGGIYNIEGFNLTLINSIIANSLGGDCPFPFYGTVSASYSLVGDGGCEIMSAGLGNRTGDPLLGPLQDNGGPTLTHALSPGSPAIDTGNSFFVPAGLTTDQRGGRFARIFGSSVDMGAFEVQPEGNTAPNATYDSFSTEEDTLLSGSNVLANDSDDEDDTLSAILTSDAASGTVSLNADGTFTYTPSLNFNGSDSFTYKANDGTVDSATATVSITINAVNDAPTAAGQSVTTDEDTAKSITLSGSDADGGDVLTYSASQPLNGSVSCTGASCTYTPNANFNGSDSFTFKVNDGAVDSNVATVDIIVIPVNDVPVANGGSITTDEDTPSPAFTLTGSDADNDSLTFEIATAPVKGTYNAATGIYTPNLNANGSDSFTFIAKDSVSQSSAVTVSITINPINDAPTANAQSVTTDEDTAEAITLSGSDPDDANTPLTYSVVGQPAHGALSGTGANLTYTPAANFSGTDSFTFRVSDGVLDSDTATVNITITAVNDAPTAVGDVYGTNEDTTLNIPAPGVLSNDSDIDNDLLTASLVSGPAHGSLTLNSNGSFAYTPNLNFYGTDSFTYKANDGSLDSNVATVTITVNPVDDASVVSVTPSSQSVQYSDAISSVAVMATDVDAASLALSWQFKVNEGGFSDGLPLGLTVGWTCTSGQSCTASLTGTPIGPAGVYTIRFTTNDGDRSVSADHILTVTKEHTETEFTGDLYALTAGPTVDTANVRLAAQLTQEEDGQPGYITKANVSFLLFNANNLGSTPDLTVNGVPVDASGAALTFVNLPVDTWTVKVKIDADNGYWKANPVGMGTITIERPTTELRTSGGGWVADVESVNGKGNFGFNVANQKKGVKGSSIYLFRGLDGFNYLVKSTSWNSGGIAFRKEGSVISLASFSGKSVVQKIDPETGEVVDSFGNYSFTVDVRDGDLFDPREPDKYAVTILDSSGLVWRQVGSRTSPMIIGGGNVTVKGK